MGPEGEKAALLFSLADASALVFGGTWYGGGTRGRETKKKRSEVRKTRIRGEDFDNECVHGWRES